MNIFGDNDSESDCGINTNNKFAKKYNKWRKSEELNKLKTKYGDKVDDDGSSSSSSDDEEPTISEALEKNFFKALAYLKSKDPKIYDENVNFFDSTQDEEIEENKSKRKNVKPLFLKEYERKLMVVNDGKLSDEEDEQEHSRSRSPTYVEEQQKLKENFKNALNADDDSDDDLLIVRKKTKVEKESNDFKEWLAGQKETIDDKETETNLKPLKDYWNNPNLDKDEQFLRDYILNKRFMDNKDQDYIPTYDEIVHDSDENLSEDEKQIAKQDEFEHKFNFRFEEPDQEFIKRYPRTVENSLRKTDDKRKLKRQEIKERKQKEKQQKINELKKLQDLKRLEIEEKIQKLKEITGNSDVAFQDDDVDGDFDPEAHDKRMQALFNEEFYKEPEEEQKPEFPDLDEYLEIENWNYEEKANNKNVATNNEPHCEDEDFNMDCDYDPSIKLNNELLENTKGKKKRKRKSNFAKAIAQPKPLFDPNDKTFEQYLDEYYKFDCEDMIGDIPCRFKYRKVTPNSFGLSIEEILLAKDRELNKWCSLKKAVQHRSEEVEKYEQIAYSKKGQNITLKKKILSSLFEDDKEKDTVDTKLKSIPHTKKQKVGISDARLSAYGINPKKYKNKLKFKKIR